MPEFSYLIPQCLQGHLHIRASEAAKRKTESLLSTDTVIQLLYSKSLQGRLGIQTRIDVTMFQSNLNNDREAK